MLTAIEVDEFGQYQGAVAEFAAAPRSTGPIETMMRLSTEAVSVPLRRWAAAWLLKTCNVLVTIADNEVHRHAATPEAANIR